MAVKTNFQGASLGTKRRTEIAQALDELFKYRAGKWHIQFIGAGDELELRVSGPGVETSDLIDADPMPADVVAAVQRALGD